MYKSPKASYICEDEFVCGSISIPGLVGLCASAHAD